MTDGEIRELCNRFFDAYQDRRVDLLAEIYSDDCIVWHRGALWICIVGLCRDGRITRIDEYMDTGKFDAWRGGARKAVYGAEGEKRA